MTGSESTDRVAALAAVPLFDGLTTEELQGIADLMTPRDVPAGTLLTEQDTPGSEAMIVVSGTALVRRSGRVIDESGPGDLIGEISLITRAPRSATVQATSDMSLLVIGADDFTAMLEATPDVAVKIHRTVAARDAASTDPGTI